MKTENVAMDIKPMLVSFSQSNIIGFQGKGNGGYPSPLGISEVRTLTWQYFSSLLKWSENVSPLDQYLTSALFLKAEYCLLLNT